MGEIAAEIAHELRNALQVIAANTYLARQDPGASAAILAKIDRHARLAQTIVDDLLCLARGDAHHGELTAVETIVLSARGEMKEGAALWRDAVEPAKLTVRVHPGLMTRLLHALYDNAVQASAPRRPTIATRAWRDETGTHIEVRDDGPGVPAELGARVFDPLVTSRPGGTGLGLALARRIATAHKGDLVLVSPDAGGSPGAVFRVTLPVAPFEGAPR